MQAPKLRQKDTAKKTMKERTKERTREGTRENERKRTRENERKPGQRNRQADPQTFTTGSSLLGSRPRFGRVINFLTAGKNAPVKPASFCNLSPYRMRQPSVYTRGRGIDVREDIMRDVAAYF